MSLAGQQNRATKMSLAGQQNRATKYFLFIITSLLLSTVSFAEITSITLNYPVDIYIRDTTPDFNFTVISNETTTDCTVYVKHATGSYIPVGTDTINNNTASKITSNTTLEYGKNYWYVFCEKGAYNKTSSTADFRLGSLKFSGLDYLLRFIQDSVTMVSNLIPLVVVLIIIGCVFALGTYLKKFVR